MFINAQIIEDKAGNELQDMSGELLLLQSDGYMVADEIVIQDFKLQPSTATINSKVAVGVKVFEGIIEKELFIVRSGDVFAGEV